MINATTLGIKISVETQYEGYISAQRKYAFSYLIRIENNSSETVQLLRRHWIISDSSGENREVEGEGIIGEQPILQPNDHHEYSSWCPLDTEIGTMHGSFLMERESDGQLFRVKVPLFKMVAPYRLN